MSKINFFYEGIDFCLEQKQLYEKLIQQIFADNEKEIECINIIFCDDSYLLKINQDFLQHDFYTDIITFDNSVSDEINADIFISIERVRENAICFKESFQRELTRVVAHGVLHLMGYDDKTEIDKTLMRKKEDFYINYFFTILK